MAPYVLVEGKDGQIRELVLDPGFSKYGIHGPVSPHKWANVFTEGTDSKKCPIVKNYYDYRRNDRPNSEHTCYLRKDLPAYYFQPLDVLRLDGLKIQKLGWDRHDLELSVSGFDGLEKNKYLAGF